MFSSLRKRIAIDTIVYPWNVGLTCRDCGQPFTVTRRKKICMFCKSWCCTMCIERRTDKRISCRKCLVLMARPIDREELFNLRSKDLVDYLSSRHISTAGCIEKEDLVNAVMRSVNAYPPYHTRRSSSGSYPTSPRRGSNVFAPSGSRSQNDLRSSDGIRVHGVDSDSSTSTSTPTEPSFVVVEPADCEPEVRVEDLEETNEVLPPAVPDPQPQPEPVVEEPETPPAEPDVCPEPAPKRLQLSDIHSDNDLEGLSIRQLKELLTLNRIDYTGCVERAELMQKARRLYADFVESRKDVENLNFSDLCKICMDAPIECVLLECGHIATCVQCGKQLSECPICRQFVVRCVRTFKA